MSIATSTTGRPCFGQWLMSQKARADQIGQLAKFAATDASFPREGDVIDAWKRINQIGADGDMLCAMEDAEVAYGGLQ